MVGGSGITDGFKCFCVCQLSKELSDLKLEKQKSETDRAYIRLLERKREDMHAMQDDFCVQLCEIQAMSRDESVKVYARALLNDMQKSGQKE